MKIGVVAASMSRRAGGVFNAMRDLSRHLEKTGVEVEVLAGRDDKSEEDKAAWGATPVRALPTAGPKSLAYQPGLTAALRRTAPDVVHLHGLWTYPSIAVLHWSGQAKPRVISPHGMLDPWALRNSGWKKRIARLLFENANLRGAACLHALCAAERDAIRALGLEAPVALVPNGVDTSLAEGPISLPTWRSELPEAAKVLLYLGRIHPKKGLAELLSGLALVRRRLGDWHLVVAGWDQGGHEEQLRTQATTLGIADRVHFVGPQFEESKRATLAAASAFVLPSVSEGLPMSVLEAWAFGRPVVMTRECNLPEGFAAGAALEIRPEAKSIADVILGLVDSADGELAVLGERGRQLAARRFDWAHIAAEMAEVYAWTIGNGPAPAHLNQVRMARRKMHGASGLAASRITAQTR